MTTAPPPTLTVGIDPGGRQTGIVVVNGRELLAAAVLDRDTPVGRAHGYSSAAWAEANLAAIERLLLEQLEPTLPRQRPAQIADRAIRTEQARIAVEDVVAPNPHVQRADGNALTNPDGILDTAIVLGAIVDRWPDVVIVAPGGHGSHPRGSYPPAIDLPAGGKGSDRARHARSAYDVAQAARIAAGRLHAEAQRTARIVEPVLYRVTV